MPPRTTALYKASRECSLPRFALSAWRLFLSEGLCGSYSNAQPHHYFLLADHPSRMLRLAFLQRRFQPSEHKLDGK
jgi:hypothetical protein